MAVVKMPEFQSHNLLASLGGTTRLYITHRMRCKIMILDEIGQVQQRSPRQNNNCAVAQSVRSQNGL